MSEESGAPPPVGYPDDGTRGIDLDRTTLAGLSIVVLLGAPLLGWLLTKNAMELREMLRWLSPRAIELAFVLMVGAFLASFGRFRRTLADGRLAPVAGIGLVAFVLVSWLPPETHRIFYDEDIYQNVAQNIVWLGRAQMCNEGELVAGSYRCLAHEYNKEPNGFPFLLSLGFRLAGVNETVAHRVNHLLFAFGAMAVYWLGCLLFRDSASAVAAAMVYVLTPQNLLWGSTVAVEPSAAATTVWALACFVLFLRESSAATGLLAASSLAFATQFRPESGLVLVAAAAFALFLVPGRERIGWRASSRVAVVAFLLLVPHFVHLASVRGEDWGSAEGGKFRLSVVAGNLATNTGYHVKGEDFPAVFTLLALLGLLAPGRGREGWSLLAWFLLFFGIFIPFYAGSYRYGADVRFSLLSAAPLALLAGRGAVAGARYLSLLLSSASGAALARALPLAVIIYASSAFLPLVRAVGPEAALARADHDVALEMVDALPADSILLTHNPGMIQVMGQTSAQSSVATYQPATVDNYFRRYSGGVYFHYNFWCNVDDETQNDFCAHILGSYGTQVLMDERAGFYRFVLYRLLPK